MPPRCNMKCAFTLMELMIAVFILAMATAILMGTQSTSLRLTGYANNLSVVTLLTKAKMQDIEYEMLKKIEKEGLKTEHAETLNGDYSEQGHPQISWTAEINAIEIQDEAANDFVENVTNQLYGSGDEAGSLSGNLAFTQFLPLMVSYLPTIINQLGQRIRKITITTQWEYLGVTQSLTVSQFSVVLAVDSASEASGASASKSPNESISPSQKPPTAN